MAQIHNDQQVYALLGRLFESVIADEELGARLHTVDAVVQQQFRRPDATVTMKLVAGEERQVITGQTDLRSEVVLVMDAATGHRVWLGELSAMAALSKGQIRARGPVAKILRLIDLIALVAPRYRAQLDALTAPAESGVEAEGEKAPGEAVEAETPEAVEEPEAAAEEPDAAADEPEAPAEEPEAAADEPAEEPDAASEPEPAAEEPEPAAEEPEPAAEEPEPAAEEPEATAEEPPGDGDTQAA